MKFLLSVIPLVMLIACAEKPPVEEYTLARSAVDAAQNSSANKYAPGLWYKAEENYRQGESLFKKGSFEEAKNYFLDAQDYAERAENKARYEKKRLGEDLP